VRFVVDKVALGQGFSEYFGFPCQLSFHLLLHIHLLSTGTGTIGELVADVPSGLSLTPPQETNQNTMVAAPRGTPSPIARYPDSKPVPFYIVACSRKAGILEAAYTKQVSTIPTTTNNNSWERCVTRVLEPSWEVFLIQSSENLLKEY
jgi:hypothetical protein